MDAAGIGRRSRRKSYGPPMNRRETMLTFCFSGTEGIMTEGEKLTSGMVGKTLYLEFSPEWEWLAKTVVFSNGQETASKLYTGNPVEIPARILKKPLRKLTVGVYGVSSDGRVVIPTIRAEGPMILPGVEPVWSPEADPELPVWAQLQAQLGDLELLETEACENLVAAINEVAAVCYGENPSGENGATFTPAVSGDGTLSWTNDRGLENPVPVNIKGPEGEKGATGMSGPYFTPRVTDNGDGTMTMSFTPSRTGVPTPGSTTIVLPGGEGYTPIRGTDYWTEADKAEIKSYVDTAILGGAW